MEKKPLHVNGIIATAKMFLTGIYFLELLSIRTETWLIVKCFFVCLPCIVCLLQFHPIHGTPMGDTRLKCTVVCGYHPCEVYYSIAHNSIIYPGNFYQGDEE